MNGKNGIKLNKGMTIIEILVVMLIFMVIASIGFSAINNFKVGSELASGSAQFENMVKTVQNNARNNVVSRANPEGVGSTSEEIFNTQIHGYLIYFSGNSYEVRSCKRLSGVGVEGWYDCSTVEPLQSQPIESVNFNSPGGSTGSVACNGILYENKTGRMNILTGISSPSSLNQINPSSNLTGSECDVEVSHVQKGSSGRVHNYKFETDGNIFREID
ncbi:prepilin-type N-terminal cleavage/methylation domain-containing protein [Candidatus Dojkabacteria bacterium]|nr:prepilin-type N-terminal cleavage/methylation domain-containing protein [Candidatus Dojkabacteria bacterium]